MLKEKCRSLEWPLTSYASTVRFPHDYYEELENGRDNVLRDYLASVLSSDDAVTASEASSSLVEPRLSSSGYSDALLSMSDEKENQYVEAIGYPIDERPSFKRMKSASPSKLPKRASSRGGQSYPKS
jgi:hypothetical protein